MAKKTKVLYENDEWQVPAAPAGPCRSSSLRSASPCPPWPIGRRWPRQLLDVLAEHCANPPPRSVAAGASWIYKPTRRFGRSTCLDPES
jgi:hypothetical protein